METSYNFLPTLRSRLTLLYITSTVAIFLLLSALFSGLLWVALHNQIDHHIHLVTTQAEQVINNSHGAQQELFLNALVQMEGMSILVINSDGELIMQKNSYNVIPLNIQEIEEVLRASQNTGLHPLHFTIHGQRFGSATVMVNDQPQLLAVGYSMKILIDTFYQMIGITFGMLILTLLPLTFLGYRLLRKYLHPLEAIAETAQLITHPKKLSSRVSGQPLTKEVSAIMSSFNGMLSRLETIFISEHEFFSDAAHTLKTPLAVLRAKAENLTKESTSKKQEIINVIDSAVDTVQDLLLISRIETGAAGIVKKVNLSSVVQELSELAQSLTQENDVRVTTDIQKNISFNADESLIIKAFGNIVLNAVQYVNNEGTVQLILKQTENKILFRVINTGENISAEELPHVFERFYRGANAQKNLKGSGLGLAITKAVVENYKGKVRVETNQSGSVNVIISLPK